MLTVTRLYYDRGTIVLEPKAPLSLPHFFKYDPRVGAFRALALHYRKAVEYLRKRGVKVEDSVLQPLKGKIVTIAELKLRNYQKEALRKWIENGMRGIIVLPTGAGKTRVALACIEYLKKPTLIVVPTIELMEQWEKRVKKYFKTKIGRFGGGDKSLGYITIATYDSAYINAEILGNKFELIVFDEVHHLPSPGYRQIAELNAAPYRLGLTATPEREDGLHVDLSTLVGGIIYRRIVSDFKGRFLADFEIKTIRVKLSDEERAEYRELMEKYKNYLKKHSIKIKSIRDFEKIIMRSGLDKEAREALLAWREAKKIAFNASAKLEVLREILAKHRGDKVIIFTENNEFVRIISEEFLIPEITYKTKPAERRAVLEGFRLGKFRAIVTSKVLEEGVDVPDANVAIVLSGTASRREFVQRLGRILRPKKGKAILYEVITSGTSETRVSRKRKQVLEED
ncbi:MAG: ATP-dependent helicase [Thermoprotei archaeon]|nr:MAG: ATP-dependent helicase [Thermoprotei archaeon]RLF00178.1 MAG: ATP-dependent helicase [Thermoprotei archaeon]HDI75289.1 DEAD/DEAH box helicase [Thermoprotei archaeon]